LDGADVTTSGDGVCGELPIGGGAIDIIFWDHRDLSDLWKQPVIFARSTILGLGAALCGSR
jgi:hypothetical protein